MTCSADCQVVTPPTGEVPSPAGTWTPTRFLFNFGDRAGESGFGPPETYAIGENGTLTSAMVTPDVAALTAGLNADTVTPGTMTLMPGVEATLYTATGSFGVELRGEIETFTLTVGEDRSATWEFDYATTFVLADSNGETAEATSRLVGAQTGVLNAAGTEIVWMTITGTATILNPFQMSEQPLATLGLTLGTWTR